jgi:hypothetical protein
MNTTFQKAHQIRSEAAARFGGKPSDYSMSEACKMAISGESVDDLEKRKKSSAEQDRQDDGAY